MIVLSINVFANIMFMGEINRKLKNLKIKENVILILVELADISFDLPHSPRRCHRIKETNMSPIFVDSCKQRLLDKHCLIERK